MFIQFFLMFPIAMVMPDHFFADFFGVKACRIKGRPGRLKISNGFKAFVAHPDMEILCFFRLDHVVVELNKAGCPGIFVMNYKGLFHIQNTLKFSCITYRCRASYNYIFEMLTYISDDFAVVLSAV